ncbi:MAG: glucose-1-phosphate cytidylyltransferase [Candidatus Parvarchaeota archaeon]
MKVVILAGGYGTRLSEETEIKPKPMVEIGGKPILWHIMKIYSSQGYNDFIVCTGYKGETIKKFFADLYIQSSNVTFNISDGTSVVHKTAGLDWKVTVVDTGKDTLTGGRILRIRNFLEDETFMLTYGDGLADINLSNLISFHKGHGKIATVTAVRPPPRFGTIEMDASGKVSSFREKYDDGGTWINGGFFVLNKGVFDYIGNDEPYFEDYPMKNLVKDGQLFAYRHNGFWRPMDTLSDKRALEDMWNKNQAGWKIWKD